MPIYEFHCEDCGSDFECLVMGQDKPVCSTCNSEQIRRRMSVCGFVSKNAGGQTVSSSTSACSGCTASSCSSCGH